MKKLVFLLAFLAVFSSPAGAASRREITPQQVIHLLREGSGLWLIDVRSPVAYERWHMEGSVNIPLAALKGRQFAAEKILVVADSSLGGLQAMEAADILIKSGNNRVFTLTGGLPAWERERLPMVGERDCLGLLRVMPAELKAARKEGSPLVLIDLRDEAERGRFRLAGAEAVKGENLVDRLATVKKLLEAERKKKLAGKLAGEKPTVLVLPVGIESCGIYQQYLWPQEEDVRILEGGYLAGTDDGRKRTTTSGDGCNTCPGGTIRGEIR
jgi:rhodanese-related sulfurtransferase